MKHYATIIMALIFCFTINFSANAQNWIPYQGYTVNTTQTIYNYPVIPQPVYVPQPVVSYQWVPYVVPQTTIVEHQCLFRQTQKITTTPTVQWFYVPTVIYK